jgi:putative colanic acid biosynthesis acetyltransferase WcaF
MTGSGSNSSMVQIDLRSSRTRWPLGILLRRAIWQGILTHIVRFTPRPFNLLRILTLRAAGAKIGAHCLIMPGVKVLMPWKLMLSDSVAIGRNTEIYNHGEIRVGSNTLISQNCFLCTSSHDYTKPDMPLIYSDIDVGSECWIAAGAYVGPGVKINNGAVIGARAVVTRDMPEWMVCAGNPCCPLKQRIMHGSNARG